MYVKYVSFSKVIGSLLTDIFILPIVEFATSPVIQRTLNKIKIKQFIDAYITFFNRSYNTTIIDLLKSELIECMLLVLKTVRVGLRQNNSLCRSTQSGSSVHISPALKKNALPED